MTDNPAAVRCSVGIDVSKDSLDIFIEELSGVFVGDAEHADDPHDDVEPLAPARDVGYEPTINLSSITGRLPR